MTKKKGKTLRIRCTNEFYDEVQEWLKLHSTHNTSDLIRSALEEKMHRDTPITSQLEDLEEMIVKKLEDQTKAIVEELRVNNKFGGKRTEQPDLRNYVG